MKVLVIPCVFAFVLCCGPAQAGVGTRNAFAVVASSLVAETSLDDSGSQAAATDSQPKNKAATSLPGPRINLAAEDLGNQIKAIETAISKGKMFSEMAKADMQKASELINYFKSIPEASRTITLTRNGEAMSNQLKLNSILDRAQHDSTLVCHFEKETGRNIARKYCWTMAETERMKADSIRNWRGMYESKLDAPRKVE